MQQLKEKSTLYLESDSGEYYTNPFFCFSSINPLNQKKRLYGNFEHSCYRIGARYYDPDIGLWISPDPARQFHSLYSYAGNGFNPIIGMDPDGRNMIYKRAKKRTLDNVPGFNAINGNQTAKAFGESWVNPEWAQKTMLFSGVAFGTAVSAPFVVYGYGLIWPEVTYQIGNVANHLAKAGTQIALANYGIGLTAEWFGFASITSEFINSIPIINDFSVFHTAGEHTAKFAKKRLEPYLENTSTIDNHKLKVNKSE